MSKYQTQRTKKVAIPAYLLFLVFCLFSCGKQTEQRQVSLIGLPITTINETSLGAGRGVSYSFEENVSEEMWAYLEELEEEGSLIDAIYRHQYISAYSPGFQSVISAEGDGNAYKNDADKPYSVIVAAITVTEVVGETDLVTEIGQHITTNIKADVDEVLALHPGYTPKEKATITIAFASGAERERMDIRPGKRYLIYGENYTDFEAELKVLVADIKKCDAKDVDLSGYAGLSYEEDKPREYCNYNSYSPALLYGKTDHIHLKDGTPMELPMQERVLDAFLTPLEPDTDVDAFLESAEGAVWRTAIQQCNIQFSCMMVIGTDCVESVYNFHQSESELVEGRFFTADEYEKGKQVCLISAENAAKTGLCVGDSLMLGFYRGADDQFHIRDYNLEHRNLLTQPFSAKIGFEGEKTYEIVGIYKQTDLWAQKSQPAFKANTVFVPNASLVGMECYTDRSDLLCTVVVADGKGDELLNTLAENGFPQDALSLYGKAK